MDINNQRHSLKPDQGRSDRCMLDEAHENRRSLRIPYCADLELKVAGGVICGTIRNIGSGGFWVDTQASLSVGQKLEFDFHFRSGNQSMRLTGQVVRKSINGFGVELL